MSQAWLSPQFLTFIWPQKPWLSQCPLPSHSQGELLNWAVHRCLSAVIFDDGMKKRYFGQTNQEVSTKLLDEMLFLIWAWKREQ